MHPTAAPELIDGTGRRWPIAAPTAHLFIVDPQLADDLADAASRVADEHRGKQDIDDHDFLVNAEVALRRASPQLLAELVRFRVRGSRDGLMLIRGLAIDDPLPATPSGGAYQGPWQDLAVSTATQLMIISVLGDAICYADEKDGRLVQDICPVPGRETWQENAGSCLLELHTEDGFHPNMPHFLSLLSLRPDHERQAMTLAAGIRAVLPLLAEEHVRVLREPAFRIRLASSFVGAETEAYSAPMPVLTGSDRDPDLCVDVYATEPLNEVAQDALASLRQLMLGALVGMVLEPGDMLLVDNRKAVHGRTGFSPRYDADDRWLRRCFAVADIRTSESLLMQDSRVHLPLTHTLIATR